MFTLFRDEIPLQVTYSGLRALEIGIESPCALSSEFSGLRSYKGRLVSFPILAVLGSIHIGSIILEAYMTCSKEPHQHNNGLLDFISFIQ